MKRTNQTLKRIVGIGVIALFFYVISSDVISGGLLANTPRQFIEEPKPEYNTQQMAKQQIPVYCGETSFVFDISSKSMEELQILVGEVRQGGTPYGDVIGILSFGHSIEKDSGTFFMTIPGLGPNGENLTCILGYGLNWTFFDDEGKKIIQQDSL